MLIPNKHNGYTRDGIRRVYISSGGGGGGGRQEVDQSNVPSYAKAPFMEMIGKGVALSEAPYQAYGGERISQFTPLQQQAFTQAGQQGVAGQVGAASGLAGAAGLGGLASRFDPMQTGQFDAQTAAQYMDPFMQNVVNVQQQAAQRQADIQATQRGAQAVRAGAFGGSRQAIQDAEADRALAGQMGEIQARGLQDSFRQAQDMFGREQQLQEQSRQFGADFGQRGLSTALQGAQTLGQLGQQQFGQEMDIMGARQQIGGQQQQQIQRILDQQFGDFQAQRDFPYQQIGFLSDLLRGTGSSTRTMAPQPTAMQNIAGLGTVAAGLGGFGGFGRAKGGEVKSYADGGITGLLDDQQLAQRQQTASPMGQLAAAQEAQQRDAMRQAVPADMPRDMDMTEQELMAALQQAMREGNETKARVIAEIIEERRMPESGIAGIAPDSVGEMPEGGLMAMAGGGMVSFQAGGVTEADANFDQARSQYQQKLDELRKFGGAQKLRNPYAYQSALQAEAAAKQNLQSAKQNRQQVLHAIGLGPVGAFARSEGRPEDSAGVMALESTAPVEPDAFNLAASATPATPAPIGIEQVVPRAVPDISTSRGVRNRAFDPPTRAEVEAQKQADAAPKADPSTLAMLRAAGFDIDAMNAAEVEAAARAQAARRQGLEADQSYLERMIEERGVYGEEQEGRIKQDIEGFTGKKENAKSMALFQAGLAILSADPSRGGLAAIGEGALKGVSAYKGDLKELEEKKSKLNDRLDRITDIRRQETMADDRELFALKREENRLTADAEREAQEILKGHNIRRADVGKFVVQEDIKARERATLRQKDSLAAQRLSLAEQRERRLTLTQLIRDANVAGEPEQAAQYTRMLADLEAQLSGGGQGSGGGTLSQADQDLINKYR